MVGGQMGGFDFRRSGTELTKHTCSDDGNGSQVPPRLSSPPSFCTTFSSHLRFSLHFYISFAQLTCERGCVLIMMCDYLCAVLAALCTYGSAGLESQKSL